MHLIPTFHHTKAIAGTLRRDQEPYYAQEMILRDYLAADRTALANERLLLSYVRTALATTGAGAALLHFQAGPWSVAMGGILAIGGIAICALGLHRFRTTRKTLGLLRETSHPKALPREGK